MSLVQQYVVAQYSEMSFRMTWPPFSHSFLSSPSSLVSSLIPHALPAFLSHRLHSSRVPFPPLPSLPPSLPTFLTPYLPHSLPPSLPTFLSHPLFLFFLFSPSPPPFLRPSSPPPPSFPLSISPLPPFQFPLLEVVVIHRDPSCHEDLRHLKNYILEVHILVFLPNMITQSRPGEVIPVTTPPNAHSLFMIT